MEISDSLPIPPTTTIPVPEARFQLDKIDFQTNKELIGQLRVQAWRNESGVDQDFFARAKWLEELDERAQHWVVTDQGVMVAAARLSIHRGLTGVPYAQLLPRELHQQFDDNSIASFSRLVVAPAYRRHAFSTILDHARLASALAAGVEMMVGGAYLSFRQNALSRLGFKTIYVSPNGPEMPDTPVHFMMYHAKY